MNIQPGDGFTVLGVNIKSNSSLTIKGDKGMRILKEVEIDGCKRLAKKLKARKKIVFGVWFHDTEDPDRGPFLWCSLTDELKGKNNIPIWQEHDCREWLHGRGYYCFTYDQVGGGVVVDVFKLVDGQRYMRHQIHGESILDGLIGTVLAVMEAK